MIGRSLIEEEISGFHHSVAECAEELKAAKSFSKYKEAYKDIFFLLKKAPPIYNTYRCKSIPIPWAALFCVLGTAFNEKHHAV